MSVLDLHWHAFSLVVFVQHLFVDGALSIGAYKARTMCAHAWHRIAVTGLITVIGTLILVSLVG